MKRSALSLSTLFFAAVAACTVALSPFAQAQGATSKISYVTVDHPGAATTTSLTCINDFDEYLGFYDDAQGNMHAFEGKKGETHFKPIDYPGAVQTYAFRINSWGEIVGTYFDKDGYQHGFLRLPDLFAQWTPLYFSFDFPGAAQTKLSLFELGTGLGTSAFGLNNWGEIAGQYADKNGVGHGFYGSFEGFTSYSEPDAGPVPGFFGGSGLSGINDFGDMAGGFASDNPLDPLLAHGFMLHKGQVTVIDPPASFLTQVFGINNRGDVSGFYYDAHRLGHGYIYNKSAKSKFLIIDVPGAVYISTVATVNNRDSFVGEFLDGLGMTHGYIGTRSK